MSPGGSHGLAWLTMRLCDNHGLHVPEEAWWCGNTCMSCVRTCGSSGQDSWWPHRKAPVFVQYEAGVLQTHAKLRDQRVSRAGYHYVGQARDLQRLVLRTELLRVKSSCKEHFFAYLEQVFEVSCCKTFHSWSVLVKASNGSSSESRNSSVPVVQLLY